MNQHELDLDHLKCHPLIFFKKKNARETDESVQILPFLPKNKKFTKSKIKLV